MDPGHHVVILGGGFGGMLTAQGLKRTAVRITLIDKSNHHLFQPLLYQVATAGLSAPSIAAPTRHIFADQKNLTVLLDEAIAIDAAAKRVRLANGGLLDYDTLVIATGATHSYFGNEHWARFAPGLKTMADAFEIRKRVLLAFEFAERESDPVKREQWLRFAVIGAGPTGVEMAGTLAEIARQTLSREFRRVDPAQARVLLIEGASRVLPPYPPELSARAQAQLRELGVEVRLGARVTDISAAGVTIDGSELLCAGTVIWAAGVAASPLGASLGTALDHAGRVLVEPDLCVAGHPDIFVIGDLASIACDGRPVPGTAPGAKQMGRSTANNIRRGLVGQTRRPFRYVDYGSLATIGRHAAVAQIGRLKLWGRPAWLFWLFIHIFFLIGFRSRLVVMIDWAWSYFTFERHARVVALQDGDSSAANG